MIKEKADIFISKNLEKKIIVKIRISNINPSAYYN